MQLNGADRARAKAVRAALPVSLGDKIGIAVSGGSDSLALLHLLAADPELKPHLHVATVDHGLRTAARGEAETVADVCAGLCVPHDILTWGDWDGQGNLMHAARAARYRLLAGWGARLGLLTIALGHTEDDLAETFLMRLARRAGSEGLAAMDPVFRRAGQGFCRPLLAHARADLRAFLTRHGVSWVNDPSNEDEGFDRVRMRRALDNPAGDLAALGLTRAALAEAARHLAEANDALRHAAYALTEQAAHVEAGDVVFDAEKLFAAPRELRHRVMSAALRFVSASEFAPRAENMHSALSALMAGEVRTLHGCVMMRQTPGLIRIFREVSAAGRAARPVAPGETALFDGRWEVVAPEIEGPLTLAPLSDAIKLCPDWREKTLPRQSLMASPALFQNGVLISAPLAGFGPEMRCTLAAPYADLNTFVLSH